MKSTYSTFDNIYLLRLHPDDREIPELGKQFLETFKGKPLRGVVISLTLFEMITTDDIKLTESLVAIFKLSNLTSIVCDFNISSASIIFHFIDNISFETSLDVESAINVFKNQSIQ
jgi:hypothetical protein